MPPPCLRLLGRKTWYPGDLGHREAGGGSAGQGWVLHGIALR